MVKLRRRKVDPMGQVKPNKSSMSSDIIWSMLKVRVSRSWMYDLKICSNSQFWNLESLTFFIFKKIPNPSLIIFIKIYNFAYLAFS